MAPVDPAVFRNEFHAKQALGKAGIDVPQECIARDADEAVRAAEAIGYPVVLKIASEDVAHKTEAGGVLLNVADAQAVRRGHAQILASVARHAPAARIDGVLVAPMVGGGTEMIAGVSQDPVFGPIVMVGMGGIHTFENDTGPDEANHDWYGIFVLSTVEGASPLAGNLGDLSIYDVAPTLLRLFDQPVPPDMIGKSLVA